MREEAVRFENYTFKYMSQMEPTLLNISLTVNKGEKILIIGPSGSGKSTLGHCINGLVPFSYKGETTGSLTVMGKPADKLGLFGLSKHVGTVLQDTDAQFIGLTVGEDIAFSMENECLEHGEMHSRVNEVSRLVDMQDFLTANPHELSGGQKQRVSLAGVLVDDVDILLFDEPLANLDPATGKHAIELIDKLFRESGKTVIIIEHRLEDALYRGADRIVLMNDGRIIADMPPSEILASGLLKEYGIREPLYITALKQAGCLIDSSDLPDSVEAIKLGRFRDSLMSWYESAEPAPSPQFGETLLSLRDISFAYESGHKAVKDISLEVRRGEMLAILGKNGAGKSTLSKLICGLEKPDKGSIHYEGRDITGDTIKERSQKIGFAMQNPNHMISKTMIFDEVALGLQARNRPEEEVRKRVEETLRICGLYPFRNWPIAALSYGQKKRVTIASILVLEPKVLILDEPTAGQDFRHYTEIMRFLYGLNKENGITIIIITHDIHLAIEYAQRSVVLADGLKIADTATSEVMADEEIIKRANLKKTSLYELAVRLGIRKPETLIRRFIDCERRTMENEQAAIVYQA